MIVYRGSMRLLIVTCSEVGDENKAYGLLSSFSVLFGEARSEPGNVDTIAL